MNIFEPKNLNRVFYQEKPAIDIAYMRILIFGFFIYKLLSRDFSIFGFAPDEVLNIYPVQQYPAEFGYSLLGIPIIVDLASFHWIHWILPFPDQPTIGAIQWLTIGACLCVILFGRGYKHCFVIGSFILLSYLWGYYWRSGGEVDAVFLPFQLALAYCFFREPEALILRKPRAPLMQFSKGNGWFYSMALLIFCSYYFFAGLNKLIDISPIQWFKFDLFQLIGTMKDQEELGYFEDLAPFFHHLRNFGWLNLIAVPITYIMELTIPAIFFKRQWTFFYWVYFILFHYLTYAVGIIFWGNMLIWSIFFPIHRLIQHLVIVWDNNNPVCLKWVTWFKKLNLFKRVNFIEFHNVPLWRGHITDPSQLKTEYGPIWVQGCQGHTLHTGAQGIQRALWGYPLFWPILPLLYIPGLPKLINHLIPSFLEKQKSKA
jgi:hypothetical protein